MKITTRGLNKDGSIRCMQIDYYRSRESIRFERKGDRIGLFTVERPNTSTMHGHTF